MDPDDIPYTTKRVAELIGLEKAVKLAKAHPGGNFYVPANPDRHHKLTRVIGINDALKLSMHFPDMLVPISPCQTLETKRKQEALLVDFQQGYSAEELSRRHGYSIRRVNNLLDSFKINKTRGWVLHGIYYQRNRKQNGSLPEGGGHG